MQFQEFQDPDPLVVKEHKVWTGFTLNIILVVLLTGFAVFTGIFMATQEMMEESILKRARAHFKDIVLIRRWNASYGGVWVEKKPGVESNPYLKNPDVQTADGRIFTKRNPAIMTREISVLAEREGDYRFHITSLKLRNPDNAPDEFETTALRAFERGNKEVHVKEEQSGTTYFRYMAPLYIEEPCLKCHADQGYKVGEVRGGISIQLDITDIETGLRYNRYLTLLLFFLTVVLLLGLIFIFVRKLYLQLKDTRSQLRAMAETDPLTGLRNRRYFNNRLQDEMQRAYRYPQPLSCILLDLDHFKNINDTHGHDAGDRVLQAVAKVLLRQLRHLDVVARYGGEEFIILMPHTDQEGAVQAAEKILTTLRNKQIPIDEETTLTVTASLGIVACAPEKIREMTNPQEFVHRADEALYQAKNGGRDRYCLGNVDI